MGIARRLRRKAERVAELRSRPAPVVGPAFDPSRDPRRVGPPGIPPRRTPAAPNIQIVGCTAENCGTGLYAEGVEGLLVAGSTFKNNGVDIVAKNLRRSTFTGNKFIHDKDEPEQ